MSNDKIRVLVIDDSPLMRRLMSDCIHSQPGMEVVATADDGAKIVELYEQYRPHVITLDVQMPKCDGLSALDLLIAKAPVPVVMVSTLTKLGANITLEALERGAVDYVAKPENCFSVDNTFTEELTKKIRIAAATQVSRLIALRRSRMERRAQRTVEAKSHASVKQILNVVEQDFLREHVIAIGISTGGPPALASMLEQLKPPLPPLLIVQHMPAMFTQAFAKRLDNISELRVKEAEASDTLLPNQVYVAPGGKHMELQQFGREIRIGIREGDTVAGHRPSVDVLFESAARLYGERMLGVIMTGMGRDGVQGCAAIRKVSGYVLGQDETTSDVYGMNKIAFQMGYVDRQFSLQHAAEEIMQYVKLHWSRSRVSAR